MNDAMQAPLGYKREPIHAFRTENETRELTSEPLRQGIGCAGRNELLGETFAAERFVGVGLIVRPR